METALKKILIIIASIHLSHCTKPKHADDSATVLRDIYHRTSTEINHLNEILAFAVGLKASDSSSGELVGIHHSGKISSIDINNCSPCIIENILPSPDGLILKGKLSIINANNNLEQSSLAFWNYKEIQPIFNKPVSKLRYKKGLLTFESSHENLLYITDLEGRSISTVNLNSWIDFTLQGDQKVLISNSDPWPKSEDDYFFIENGDQLLGSSRFMIDTKYEEKRLTEDLCHDGQYFWKAFSAHGEGYTRSIVPAPFAPGAISHQDESHIFVTSQDRQAARAISLYAQIPLINRNYFSFYELDHDNHLVFDGFNLIQENPNHKNYLLPYSLISYDFFDLDYISKIFYRKQGFSQIMGITKDGYLTPIDPKSGAIDYKHKKKISYSQIEPLQLIRLDGKIKGLNTKSFELIEIIPEAKSYSAKIVKKFDEISQLEEVFQHQNHMIVFANKKLYKLNSHYNLKQLNSNNCSVIAANKDSDIKIITIEKCFDSHIIAKYQFVLDEVIRTESSITPKISDFIKQNHGERFTIQNFESGYKINSYENKNCRFSSIIASKTEDFSPILEGPKFQDILGSYFKKQNGEIISIHSIGNDKILLSGKTAYGYQNVIFFKDRSLEIHIPQWDQIAVSELLSLSDKDVILSGTKKGEPTILLVNINTMNTIEIYNGNEFFIRKLTRPNINDDGLSLPIESLSN